LVVAITLIVGGIVLIWVEKRNGRVENTDLTDHLYHINLRQALLIGFAQTLAYIPGMSRSAASIIGGMIFGLNREVATRFSFYLAIPTLGGATIVDLLLNLDQVTSNDLVYLLVGTIISGLVAWFAVGWLLRYIANNNFIPFGYYRIAAGLVFLALIAVNVL
jgi:undecaprenyl-diphosphatase